MILTIFLKFWNSRIIRKPLFIFIGDLGTNVLNDLYCINREANHYLAISTDLAHLTNNVKIENDFKIFIGDKTDNSCGKRDFDSGLEYVKHHKRLLRRKIRKFRTDRIVLVAGLRFSSASGVIAGLSQLFSKSRKEICAIVSTPFEAEGENAKLNSIKALEILRNNNVKLSDFSCEELLQSNGGKLLIRDLDSAFEERVRGVVEINFNE
jgi:cell division GTPase FtsZ